MSLNAEKKILPKISMRKTKKRVAAAQPPPNSKPPLEADAPAQNKTRRLASCWLWAAGW